jgi:hypothetical protein
VIAVVVGVLVAQRSRDVRAPPCSPRRCRCPGAPIVLVVLACGCAVQIDLLTVDRVVFEPCGGVVDDGAVRWASHSLQVWVSGKLQLDVRPVADGDVALWKAMLVHAGVTVECCAQPLASLTDFQDDGSVRVSSVTTADAARPLACVMRELSSLPRVGSRRLCRVHMPPGLSVAVLALTDDDGGDAATAEDIKSAAMSVLAASSTTAASASTASTAAVPLALLPVRLLCVRAATESVAAASAKLARHGVHRCVYRRHGL